MSDNRYHLPPEEPEAGSVEKVIEDYEDELDRDPETDMAIMFRFLDQLRESGAVNMFGARPHLAEAFDLGRNESAAILGEWMRTSSDRHPEG